MADTHGLPTSADWIARAEALAAGFAAQAQSCDESDAFVAENYAALKREGFFKAHVPVELGGGGASYREIAGVIRRLGAACSSTALAFAMHTHIVAVNAWRWRHQGAPTDGMLKRVAAENLVLISSGGSDWLASAGRAVKVEGGFRISARKGFASGVPAGDLLVTSAVYDDPQDGPTVLHFAVSLKAEGASVRETWRAMGMRGTGSHDVELNEVFVADAAISGKRPQGKWHPLFHAISLLAFPLIYSAYMGVADGARAKAIEIARKKPADEAGAYLVGELENAHTSAALAYAHMLTLAETQTPGPEATSQQMIARTLVARHAIETCECALLAAGGGAYYRHAGLERAFRDVQACRFHPLQEKPQTRYTGRVLLGLDIDG